MGAVKTALGIVGCFIVLGFVFYVIEARWPEDKLQTSWKRESGISGFFLIFNLLVTLRIAESVVLTGVAVFTIMHIPRLSPTLISRQPLLVQLVELAILKDFLMYWSHRMFHEIPFLWRFHAVHHSAKNVNWIDSGREHPLESIISKMTTLLPLVLLGFPPTILGPYVGIWTVFTMLLHSNCTWDYGKFRNFVVSPAFHRWHHASDEPALNKNYSSLLPIWDYLFRTVYFPKGKHAEHYGLYEQELPETVLHQLVGPFQPKDDPALRETAKVYEAG
jgi:sterol desaturase/sphingolipid hydroxylase (fatty acid hydroxylase superfamily)